MGSEMCIRDRPIGGRMRNIKILTVLMLTVVLTSCGGIGKPPSSYTAKIYPTEGDFDNFETHGPFSSRDECTAKAQEMGAAAYSCDPADPPPAQ